jgi:hypothetical protein
MIPKLERSLIAPCGIHCGTCNDYIAYTTSDKDAMKRAVSEVSKAMGRNVAPEEIKCLGCWRGVHTEHSACITCEIRSCAEKKEIISCALCDDFPCDPLNRRISNNHKNSKHNLYRIKEVGLEVWFKEIKQLKKQE